MYKRLLAVLIVALFGSVLTLFSVRTVKEIVKKEGDNGRERFNAAKREGKSGDAVDVIVLGDSESYTSVSPMQLWEEQGITAYVCGQPRQKIQNTYAMFQTALQLQSPKLIILETNLMFREPGPVAGRKILMKRLTEDNEMDFRYLTYQTTIQKGKWPGELCYKGFVLRGGVSSFESGDYMKETTKVQKIPGTVLDYMEAIQKICEKRGITLVLMSAPSPKNYNFKKHNAIEEYAVQHNLFYIDLNMKGKELKMDWKSDSYDKGDHLNLNGARKVTSWLGKYLKEQYALVDHRGQLGYGDWDEELVKYRESVRKIISNIK